MAINCDVVLQSNATREQLANLGAALWRWCTRGAGDTSIYQCLDNQVLADLIAGKLPRSSPMPRQVDQRGVRFRIRDEASHDRQATIERLRREIPSPGVEDIVVDGTSWSPAGLKGPNRRSLGETDHGGPRPLDPQTTAPPKGH